MGTRRSSPSIRRHPRTRGHPGGQTILAARGTEPLPRDEDVNTTVIRKPGTTNPTTEGLVLGRYRAGQIRWRHPLGKVYDAIDTESGERVDLTLLHPALALDNTHVESCLQDARKLASVDSPMILRALNVLRHPDGRLGIVTGHVDARVLAADVSRRPLPLGRSIAILRQICHALSLAHRAGVVHGALTTGSVLLTGRGGRPDAVILTDFGLREVIEAQLRIPDEDAAFQPAAPERILGLTRTAREDIYLVGCLGYLMLTGAAPFRTGDAENVQRRHAIEDVMPIPDRLRGQRVPPEPIVDLVHRCLSKEAEDRYDGMADLEAHLCLAQIEAKIRTPWDDLPVPDVSSDLRRKIADGLRRGPARSALRDVAVPGHVDVAPSRKVNVDDASALLGASSKKSVPPPVPGRFAAPPPVPPRPPAAARTSSRPSPPSVGATLPPSPPRPPAVGGPTPPPRPDAPARGTVDGPPSPIAAPPSVAPPPVRLRPRAVPTTPASPDVASVFRPPAVPPATATTAKGGGPQGTPTRSKPEPLAGESRPDSPRASSPAPSETTTSSTTEDRAHMAVGEAFGVSKAAPPVDRDHMAVSGAFQTPSAAPPPTPMDERREPARTISGTVHTSEGPTTSDGPAESATTDATSAARATASGVEEDAITKAWQPVRATPIDDDDVETESAPAETQHERVADLASVDPNRKTVPDLPLPAVDPNSKTVRDLPEPKHVSADEPASPVAFDDASDLDEIPRRRGIGLYVGLLGTGVALGVAITLALRVDPEPPTASPDRRTTEVAADHASSPAKSEAAETKTETKTGPTPPTDEGGAGDSTATPEPPRPPPDPNEAAPNQPPEKKPPVAETPEKPAPAKSSTGGGGSAAALAHKGNEAFNRGDFKMAATYLRRAVAKAPNDAAYRITLGDAYYKLGKTTFARQQYEKARDLGHPSAEKRLAKVQ